MSKTLRSGAFLIGKRNRWLITLAVVLAIAIFAGIVGSTILFQQSRSTVSTGSSSNTSAVNSTSTITHNSSVSMTSGTVLTLSNAASTSPKIHHVWVIILENQAFPFASSAPYLIFIANSFASAGNYHAVTHPSLPNYMALTGASYFGISNDNSPPSNIQPATAQNIVNLLGNHAITWKAYMESMPAPCFQSNSGLYAVRHDPFVYYQSITSNSSYCDSHVVDFAQLQKDISSNSLPSFVWITPNVNDDGHDTSLQFADAWLRGFLTPIISNQTIMNGTVIFVTFDEGTTSSNQVYFAAIGNSDLVRQGFISKIQYDHYSLVATIERIFRVGSLGRNDLNSTVMSDLFSIAI